MFDEGSGSIAYDSAGSSDGALIGNPVWGTGQVDGALEFDGDDYVDCGNAFDIKVPLPVTISSWINISQINEKNVIIHTDYSAAARYGIHLKISTSGTLNASFKDGGGNGQGNRRTKHGSITLTCMLMGESITLEGIDCVRVINRMKK